MATEKNTLKNWFKNLAKPTQEQFWAWIDAYWHKDEKIPAGKIEGFDELLSNLPDANALKNYLLRDGANIDEEIRAILREKLGIGDIPSNVATIDEDDNEGSVYTKAQVDAKIPEDTNLSNTDLTIAENDVRALNVLGRLQITGLENKTDDPASNRILCQNEDGTLGYRTIVANIIIWEDEENDPPNDNNIYIRKLVV